MPSYAMTHWYMLQGIFSEDGQPGAGLRREFLALEQALSMPESVSRSPLAEGAGLAGKDRYFYVFVLEGSMVCFGNLQYLRPT